MDLDRDQLRLLKQQHREQREQYRRMKSQTQPSSLFNQTLDCACLIHSVGYDWKYVDILYNMLCRNFSTNVRLHVYTEASRSVPSPYIKHSLEDWGIAGPKKSWWYKLQLFNSQHHAGPLLYFDLDVVIVKNIDWLYKLDTRYFWAAKDFKSLWKPMHLGINSSVMFWNTLEFDWVWKNFDKNTLPSLMRRYQGDQDYISDILTAKHIRYMDSACIKSWRWQLFDGGYDFKRRTWKTPGSGTQLDSDVSVLVLHGKPKPDQTQDPVILQHWY